MSLIVEDIYFLKIYLNLNKFTGVAGSCQPPDGPRTESSERTIPALNLWDSSLAFFEFFVVYFVCLNLPQHHYNTLSSTNGFLG